ncbi:MAG: protein kinase, partial [Planctomycetota bacterium]
MDANAKTRLSEQAPDPFVGRTFGGYRIEGVIGRGGMGTVYRARQLSLGRPVAIKVLPLDLAREEQFLERFHREADALSRLSHPNVVAVFDRGEVEGQPYLVME